MENSEIIPSPPRRSSTDDFDIGRATNSIDKFIEKENEKDKPQSKIRQFFTKIYQIVSPPIIWFSNTYSGKIVKGALKFLFSSPVGRLLTITVASLTIAGILPIAFPVLAPVILGGAILGIVVVGITTIMDTIKLRRDTRVAKHASLVTEWMNNEHKKQQIQDLNPELKEILSLDYNKPNNIAVPHPIHHRHKVEMTKNVGKVILSNTPTILNTIVNILSAAGGLIPLGKLIINTIVAIVKFSYSLYTAKKSADQIKTHIKQINSYTGPAYTSLEELKLIAKKQQIEVAAIVELIADKDYLKLIGGRVARKEELTGKFTEYKAAITKLINDKKHQTAGPEDKRSMVQLEIKKMREQQVNLADVVANHLKEEKQPNIILDYGKCFLKVLNPFANKPKTIEKSSLVKGRESQEVEETNARFLINQKSDLPRKNSAQSLNTPLEQFNVVTDRKGGTIARSATFESLGDKVNLNKDYTHLLKKEPNKEVQENSASKMSSSYGADYGAEDLTLNSSSQLPETVELRKESSNLPPIVVDQKDKNNSQETAPHVQRVRTSRLPQSSHIKRNLGQG